MRRLLLALLCALLLAPPARAKGLDVSWNRVEEYYPDGSAAQDAAYRFSYAYPVVAGDSLAAALINDYFTVALEEMRMLVVPMYAREVRGEGLQTISLQCRVTCNDGACLSVLTVKEQTIDGETRVSLSSCVFAAAGEYAGETLTLRGATGLGDSSAQLAALVLADIARAVCPRWGVTEQALRADFFPEQDFYLDEAGNVVFYVQPGFAPEGEEGVFVYSLAALAGLLETEAAP